MKRQFPSVDKPLRIQAPQKISPSKRAFEKYKPRGVFSEFYGILMEPIAIDEPLYMVNSDESEVAMIAFDEATIALPSDQV